MGLSIIWNKKYKIRPTANGQRPTSVANRQLIRKLRFQAEKMIHNFNAGPSILPKEVYEECRKGNFGL